ncbi:MAG: SPOR domain-containing protein [Akkermansiaceae bacterium]|nr:SPOR domain-containing protein [Akkermansiaceae bacterium]
MTIPELKQKLYDEGCSPCNYAIESSGSDVYCLNNDGAQWKVYYTERGYDFDPIFTSESESEACDFFLQHMLKQSNWHLVGVFQSELEAKAYEREVSRFGATPIRNDLPESIMGTAQFRVFVAGRDIHLVESIRQ